MGAGARTFEQCYAAARPRVVAALAITSGDADLAQECADEAFARALGRWERLTVGDAPVEPWVYRVALNHLRRTMRRRGIERRLLIRTWRPSLPAIPHPEVWIAVAALPRRQREVVLLR
jgi:RNA polymerase sigma-70 factor (ECF subfamily)